MLHTIHEISGGFLRIYKAGLYVFLIPRIVPRKAIWCFTFLSSAKKKKKQTHFYLLLEICEILTQSGFSKKHLSNPI